MRQRGALAALAFAGAAHSAQAESVPAYPTATPPRSIAAAPRFLGRAVLRAQTDASEIAVVAAAILPNGAAVFVLHEGLGAPGRPLKVIHVATRQDGTVLRSRDLVVDFQEQPLLQGSELVGALGRYVVRQEGTAAYLETHPGGSARLFEVGADGAVTRTPIEGNVFGYLLAPAPEGYVAVIANGALGGFDAARPPSFALIARDGKILWRTPVPPRFGKYSIGAAPRTGGVVAVFSIAEERPGDGKFDVLASLTLGRDGAIGGRRDSRFPAVGPYQRVDNVRPLPPDGSGGFVVTGTAFASNDPFCLWLDGVGTLRVANNVGIDRRRAADCPAGPLLAFADGSVIGMREFGDSIESAEGDRLEPGEQDVIALDRGGRRLWRLAREKGGGQVGALLLGADDTLWLIGVARPEGKPATAFVDRYGLR